MCLVLSNKLCLCLHLHCNQSMRLTSDQKDKPMCTVDLIEQIVDMLLSILYIYIYIYIYANGPYYAARDACTKMVKFMRIFLQFLRVQISSMEFLNYCMYCILSFIYQHKNIAYKKEKEKQSYWVAPMSDQKDKNQRKWQCQGISNNGSCIFFAVHLAANVCTSDVEIACRWEEHGRSISAPPSLSFGDGALIVARLICKRLGKIVARLTGIPNLVLIHCMYKWCRYANLPH
jgi:hypothetical protein